MATKIIHNRNVDNFYKKNAYNDVIKIVWKVDILIKNVLDKFLNVKILDCSFNNITTLEPLSNLINLQELYCNNNKITNLEPLSKLTKLEKIFCSNNKITSLQPIIYFKELQYINYLNNPIEIHTIQVVRFLNILLTKDTNNGIYNKSQNIHDININNTIKDSINNLVKDPKPDINIDLILNAPLNKLTIETIIKYINDKSIHMILLIRYEELFYYVWQRIIKSEYYNILLKKLEEQIKYTISGIHCHNYVSKTGCDCFTERFNRLLYVLVDYYEDINVEISDNDKIWTIIQNIKNKYTDIYQVRKISKLTLVQSGYTLKEIEPWLDVIE